MRIFLGMLLGAVLTVLTAYVYDSTTNGPAVANSGPVVQRTMVNWDVVGENWRSFKARAHAAWVNLSGHIART